jgi:hypothetical protein
MCVAGFNFSIVSVSVRIFSIFDFQFVLITSADMALGFRESESGNRKWTLVGTKVD